MCNWPATSPAGTALLVGPRATGRRAPACVTQAGLDSTPQPPQTLCRSVLVAFRDAQLSSSVCKKEDPGGLEVILEPDEDWQVLGTWDDPTVQESMAALQAH